MVVWRAGKSKSATPGLNPVVGFQSLCTREMDVLVAQNYEEMRGGVEVGRDGFDDVVKIWPPVILAMAHY